MRLITVGRGKISVVPHEYNGSLTFNAAHNLYCPYCKVTALLLLNVGIHRQVGGLAHVRG